jgi:hypothetical protein
MADGSNVTRCHATPPSDSQERCDAIAVRWGSWPLSYAFYSWHTKVLERKEMLVKASSALLGYAGKCLARALRIQVFSRNECLETPCAWTFSGGLLRKSWWVWRQYAAQRSASTRRLEGALMMMGGMRMAQCFYWWLALAQYLRHMDRSFHAIHSKASLYICVNPL